MRFHRSAVVYVWCRTFCTSVRNIGQYTVTQVSRDPWYKTYLECRVVAFFSLSTSSFVIEFAKTLIWLLHFITQQFTSSTIDVLQSIVRERHSFVVASFPVLIAIGCFTLWLSLTHRRRIPSFTFAGNKQFFGCSRYCTTSSVPSWWFALVVVEARGYCSSFIARGRLREILFGVNRTTL